MAANAVDNSVAANAVDNSVAANTVDEELINAPFYHGFQTRPEADALLKTKDGSFLVRMVHDYDNSLVYVVSVFWRGIKHHYRIEQTKHKHFYFLNGVPKRTIPSLIRFHRFTQTPVNDESGARLRRFVERTHYALYREQLTLHEVVGRGEFGEVRHGTLRLGFFSSADVAVKMMFYQGDHVNVNERIRFLREANLMMRLRHKNVIRLYGVVIYDDPILIVTEYAEGGSLLGRLHCDPVVNDEQKLSYCRDICFGMAYLERESVIHRDLAARNCLLDNDDRVKIADFGLSLVGNVGVSIVKKGKAPIRYCPPETLRSAIYSNKTDVWSFGIVLFEIWSNGEVPYAEVQANKELRHGIISGKFRVQSPVGMPNEMVELLRIVHSTNPGRRPTFAKIAKKWFGGEVTSCKEKIAAFFRSMDFVF